MNDVNQIVVMRERFSDDVEYECAVSSFIELLLRAGYVMVVRTELGQEEQTIIEFNEDKSQHLGNTTPHWLTEEQMESIYSEDE